jgi:outer membrane protein assembly factor BamD (BamD/ComL family)
MKCTFSFGLFLFCLLMSFAFAKPKKDSSDKEYIAIFKDIENSDYKTAIEKLKAYHSKGKSQERSDLLLGQLYVMDKDYPSAFNVFFEIPKKERDVVYLTIVIDSMNKQFAENKKIEKNEAVTPVIMSFLDKNTKYSQKSKDLMKAFLSYYPDSSLEKKYCEDLQKKNQEKCDLEKGIR